MIKNRIELLKRIKQIVDGETTKQRVAIMCDVSVRTIERYVKSYKEHGESCFLSNNTVQRKKTEFQKRVVDIYLNDCFDFNFTHFNNILEKEYGIKISNSYVRRILFENNIVSPICWKRTAKQYESRLKKNIITIEDKEKNYYGSFNYNYERYHHSRKPRSKYFGECIQLDATSFEWCNNTRFALHLALDDATSEIVGAFFDYEETIYGYYNVLYQMLTKYGIPLTFLTDNRNIFNYNSGYKNLKNHNITHFEEKCKKLGIMLKTSSVPQKKGRVERAHGSIKRRLPQELRYMGVETMEQANEYLAEFIESYNELFALKNVGLSSVFEKVSDELNLNVFLSSTEDRTVDNGGCIVIDKKYYYFVEDNGNVRANLKPRSRGKIHKCLDGQMVFEFDNVYYQLIELEERYETSKDFDNRQQ